MCEECERVCVLVFEREVKECIVGVRVRTETDRVCVCVREREREKEFEDLCPAAATAKGPHEMRDKKNGRERMGSKAPSAKVYLLGLSITHARTADSVQPTVMWWTPGGAE